MFGGTHVTYPQRDGGLSHPLARLSQESASIEPGTSRMKARSSTELCRPPRVSSLLGVQSYKPTFEAKVEKAVYRE